MCYKNYSYNYICVYKFISLYNYICVYMFINYNYAIFNITKAMMRTTPLTMTIIVLKV